MINIYYLQFSSFFSDPTAEQKKEEEHKRLLPKIRGRRIRSRDGNAIASTTGQKYNENGDNAVTSAVVVVAAVVVVVIVVVIVVVVAVVVVVIHVIVCDSRFSSLRLSDVISRD